jgi:cell division septation protein DedD
LCSIFFILGMLVGHQQGPKVASTASATKSDAKATPKEDKPDFTFYDSVKKENQLPLQPPPAAKADSEPSPPAPVPPSIEPAKKAAPEPERKPAAEPAPPAPAPSNAINYQIGIFRKADGAQKLLEEVKKKGFRAFILTPAGGDANPVFKVQVGPFTDLVEAQEVKKKLESEKYQVIVKK